MKTKNSPWLTLLLSVLAAPLSAETVGDTLIVRDVNKVKIETRDTVQRIVISGAKDDPDFHYVQRIAIPDTTAVRRKISSVRDFNKVAHSPAGKKGAIDVSLHMNFGLNTMTGTPDGYGVKLWPSIDYGMALTADYYPFGPKNGWSLGLGVNWRTYRMAADRCWLKNADGYLYLDDFGAGQTDVKADITVFSLQIPIVYTHTFDKNRKWALGLGTLVNFNTGAHVTRSFTYMDDDYEVKTYGIGQRPVTLDFLLTLRSPALPNLYLKYSPTTFFRAGRGPKMHQLSFGLYL